MKNSQAKKPKSSNVDPPITNGKELVRRDERGRVLPGVVLNPNGRPVGTKNFTTGIREMLETVAGTAPDGTQITYNDALKKKILAMAVNEGSEQIIKLIWNYLDGMPLQAMTLRPGLPEDEDIDPNTKALIDKRFSMNIKK